MTQAEKREYLITELLKESPEYENLKIPTDETEQKKLLRSLFNIRMPLPVSDDFITILNLLVSRLLTFDDSFSCWVSLNETFINSV